MFDKRGLSAGTGSLTNAYSAIELTNTVAVDSGAQRVPAACLLDWLFGQFSSIAGGATTVTWFLSLDAAGDIPLTDEVTESILVGQTTATAGTARTLLETSYAELDGSDPGSLYLWAKLDAGTADVDAIIAWSHDARGA